MLVDTAILVISLVLGFALVLMFIYRLGIEERFDRAAVCCLVGGLLVLGMATVGRTGLSPVKPVPDAPVVTQKSDSVDWNRLNAQASTAIVTANKALMVASQAKEYAALKPSIAKLDAHLSALRGDLSKKAPPAPKKRGTKSAWTRRMEARIRELERQIREIKLKADPAASQASL